MEKRPYFFSHQHKPQKWHSMDLFAAIFVGGCARHLPDQDLCLASDLRTRGSQDNRWPARSNQPGFIDEYLYAPLTGVRS